MHRLARRVAAAVVLVLVGVFVGATALTHTHVRVRVTHRTLPPAQVTPTIACPGARATMSCILQHQAPPSSTARELTAPIPGKQLSLGSTTASQSAAAKSIYGVDFGWGTMSASGLRAIGARFAASYLSPEPNPKNWTLAAVRADHAAGIATVAVWEATATRSEDGYAAGVTDAIQARTEAAALGDTTEGIDFAVDCDCAVSSVIPYFRGVHHILGSRTGIYGGYHQVMGIHALGLVGNANWATYAWSDGLFPPASVAPLEQYLNGNAFDNDRAIASLYGQWPTPPVTKPKPRLICLGAGARNTKTCRTVRADVARWQKGAIASGRVYTGRRCAAHSTELATLNRRWAWFQDHLRRYPHIRRAHREQALAATRRAIHRERTLISRDDCRLFAHRVKYFDGKLSAAEKRYSR